MRSSTSLSDKQLARYEPAGFLGFWRGEKMLSRRIFNESATMQEYDVTGKTSCLTKIVG